MLRSILQKSYAGRRFARARRYAAQGSHAEAVWSYEECLRLNPEAFEAAFNLAICLTKLERWTEALNAYDRSLAIRPAFEAWLNKGLLLQRLGKHEDALDCINDALRVNPTHVKGLRAKAQLCLARRDLRTARTAVQAVLEQEPHDDRSLWIYAGLLTADKRYQDAVAPLAELVARDPLGPKARHFLQAVQYKTENPNSPDIETPLPIAPCPPSGNGGASIQRALILDAQGADIAALQAAGEAVHEDPHSAVAWLVLGFLLQAKTDYAGALSAIDRAILESPFPSVAPRVSGSMLHEGDTWDSTAHCARGECLARLERHGEAVEAFRRAERQGSRRPLMHRNLAVCLGRLGRDREAQTAARRAVELDPRLGATLPRLSWQARVPLRDFECSGPLGHPDALRGPAEGYSPPGLATIAGMILWIQLLRRGFLKQLLHFYGALWLASAIVMVSSVGIAAKQSLFVPTMEAAASLWPIALIGAFLVGYVTCTIFGSIPALILSMALPLMILSSSATVGSERLILAGAGLAVFGGLSLLSQAVYMLAPLPYFVVGYYRWPHRRAMTSVIVVTGGLAVGLLRVLSGTDTATLTAYVGRLAASFDRVAWIVALLSWLWSTLGYFLARYDAAILAPLLRRVGYRVPDQLTTQYVNLVDELVNRLRDRDDL